MIQLLSAFAFGAFWYMFFTCIFLGWWSQKAEARISKLEHRQ